MLELPIKSSIYWHSIKLKSTVIILSHITVTQPLSPVSSFWDDYTFIGILTADPKWLCHCLSFVLPVFFAFSLGSLFLSTSLEQFNLIYLCSPPKATNELLFALCWFYAQTFDLSLLFCALLIPLSCCSAFSIDYYCQEELRILFVAIKKNLKREAVENFNFIEFRKWTDNKLKMHSSLFYCQLN